MQCRGRFMIKFDYDGSHRKGRLTCDEDMLEFIRNHFSVKNPNASFANKKLKSQGSSYKVSDRNYAIQKTGRFDFGLFREIEDFLVSEQITDIEHTGEFVKFLNCGFENFQVFNGLKLNLRDYQEIAIGKCLNNGRGTVVVGTGGGKSLIQASLLENWKRLNGTFKCLLIVPGLSLVSQLLNDFEKYGVSFTVSGWTGGPKGMELRDTEVIIVNSENLCSKFDEVKFLKDVDLVLVDECHKNRFGNQISKLVSKIKTPHKFGFTGTLPKDKMDEWKIIGTFGPVIYEKDSKELRDENYLANVKVRMLELVHHSKMSRGYKAERNFLEQSEDRMNLIVGISEKLRKNVLILVDRLEYGENLKESLQQKNSGKKVWFISGEMPVETRQMIVNTMENHDDVACIAMFSIFSTGINIRNLHYIVFTFGGKSFVRTIQSVGRGLRLHESKTGLVLFDLYDRMKYSMEHAEERKKFYEGESIPWMKTTVNL